MGLPRSSTYGNNEPSAPVQDALPYPPPMPYAAPPPYDPSVPIAYQAVPNYGAAPVAVVIDASPIVPESSPPEIVPVSNDKNKKDKSHFRGPLDAKRSCTDIICFFLFIIVFIGFVVITLSGIFAGNPLILLMGHDSEGQVCGVGPVNRIKINLFSFDPINCFANDNLAKDYARIGCTTSVCVQDCPQVTWNWLEDADKLVTDVSWTYSDGRTRQLALFCRSNLQTSETVREAVTASKCPPYFLPSSSDFFFRCEPKFFTQNITEDDYAARNTLFDANSKSLPVDKALSNVETAHNSFGPLSMVASDFSKTWPHILFFTVLTMGVSLIWIILMQFIGPVLIWFSVLVFVLGSIITCVMSWIIYDALNQGYTVVLGIIPAEDLATVPKDVWLTIGILTSISSLVLLIVFCAVFNRIRLAAAIVQESSKAIFGSLAALIWPIFPFGLQLGVHALFVVGMFYFLTVTSNGEQSITAAQVEQNILNMWPLFLSLLFAWFWITNFILALNYVTLAGSFSSWYWNHGTKDSEKLQLLGSLWRALRYHIGSMAFGALIVAIVQLIRTVLQYFERQFRKMKNPIGALMLKCLICCIMCVEKLLKFITKNAYIMVALKGRHFCYSARKAFKLIIDNALRVIVLDTISSVLIAISVFVIVGGVGVFALFVFYPYLVNWTPGGVIPEGLQMAYIPLIIVIILSLLAALCFFSVYKMAIDTIFLNIMYDFKYNDGTPEKPYRAKKSLLRIAGKKNKKAEKEN